MQADLDFRILGPLAVRVEDRELPLRTGTQRAVLAILLVHLNAVVSTEQLVEQLWPERAPGRPQTAIQGRAKPARRGSRAKRRQWWPTALQTLYRQILTHDEALHVDTDKPRTDGDTLIGRECWPALADFAYDPCPRNRKARS